MTSSQKVILKPLANENELNEIFAHQNISFLLSHSYNNILKGGGGEGGEEKSKG